MNINPRKIWGELTKPWGRTFLFVIILLSIVFFFNIWKGRQGKSVNTNVSAETAATPPPAESKGYSFRSSIPEPLAARRERKDRSSEEPVISRVITAAAAQTEEPPPPIPQTIFARKESNPEVSDEFLPFGALLKCQLANAVESTNLDTPIFGYVIEDVYGPGGNLIIPAGTEVHGSALKSSARDRIGAQQQFILVFIESGRELKVTASLLDHAPRNTPDKWAETDGSGGLRGYQVKLDKYAEAKAILGSALAAGATAFPEQISQMGPFGGVTSTSKGGWQTAASEGLGAGADIYARRLLEAMKEFYYVRVDAGTYFYLYVRQTISLADAKIGGSREQSDTPNSRSGAESAAIQSIHIQ